MADAKRKRIGLFFLAGENWLGGVYYIQNIIKALKYLQESEQPEIVLICNGISKTYAADIEYPRLEIISYPVTQPRLVTYLRSIILRKNFFVGTIIKDNKLDGLFPLYDFIGKIKGESNCKIIAWYPDLQHKIYPQYFSWTSRWLRDFRIKKMLKNAPDLVLSSRDTLSHFKKFYKFSPQLRLHILPFCVVNNNKLTDFNILGEKYAISKDYFIVSNQFYEHKNHFLLLKSVRALKERGIESLLYLTGKFENYNKPGYIEQLSAFIKENRLEDSVIILGIIPREEQLSLIKHSIALIQPSKFEGWNTSIEAAKSFGATVVCSNIDVHTAQLGENAYYFDRDNPIELSVLMEGLMNKKLPANKYKADYEKKIYNFANSFLSLFN